MTEIEVMQRHVHSYRQWAGVATFCGLDGLGKILDTCPDWLWGPPSLLYSGYQVTFPEVKRLVHGIDHPSPSFAEVTERIELYRYSLPGPSWPVLG